MEESTKKVGEKADGDMEKAGDKEDETKNEDQESEKGGEDDEDDEK